MAIHLLRNDKALCRKPQILDGTTISEYGVTCEKCKRILEGEKEIKKVLKKYK